jgi:hypothetical protein
MHRSGPGTAALYRTTALALVGCVLLASCKVSKKSPTRPTEVASQLTINPPSAALQEDWTQIYEISGDDRGTPPYTWTVNAPLPLTVLNDSSRVRLTAAATGTYTITAQSSDGLTGRATAHIGSRVPVASSRVLRWNAALPNPSGGVGHTIASQGRPGILRVTIRVNEPGEHRLEALLYDNSTTDRRLLTPAITIPVSPTGSADLSHDGSACYLVVRNLSPIDLSGEALIYFIPNQED